MAGGIDSDDEEKADLVARIKQIQRESDEGKQQWWSFCDTEGFNNRRDPLRHTTEFLRKFFEARRDGRIVATVSVAPPNEIDPEMHKIWVGRVKQVQRSSPESKLRWEKYCDAYGGGVRDPQRHDSEYLRRFFEDPAGQQGGVAAAAPGMQAWPGMAGFPGLAGQGVAGQGMAGYPQMPGFPQMPGMPGMMGFPQMPGYPMMPGMMPWGLMGGAFPAATDGSSHPGAVVPGVVDAIPPALEDADGSRSRSRSKAKSKTKTRTKTKAESRSRSRRRRKVKHKQKSSSDSSS